MHLHFSFYDLCIYNFFVFLIFLYPLAVGLFIAGVTFFPDIVEPLIFVSFLCVVEPVNIAML